MDVRKLGPWGISSFPFRFSFSFGKTRWRKGCPRGKWITTVVKERRTLIRPVGEFSFPTVVPLSSRWGWWCTKGKGKVNRWAPAGAWTSGPFLPFVNTSTRPRRGDKDEMLRPLGPSRHLLFLLGLNNGSTGNNPPFGSLPLASKKKGKRSERWVQRCDCLPPVAQRKRRLDGH